ncbi:MAG: histidine triad nucleotide-binding protein [Candidatus Obscuribacter sp.]|jgi:histidine triad (HIT) family protein|nr:histidine triad nucleotide-binding protein [Candidatus Obscuribacter sp.]MDQ5966453.1 histidine triad family protein [Cyanobacteriota bacterium erpe_2018_sw_39hr_WHONDRS-SW48-000098_B_bin.30]
MSTQDNSEQNCLFCKISQGEMKAAFVYQDKNCFAIQDINPQAPTHILVIPREHKQNIALVNDKDLLGELFQKACLIAEREKLSAPDKGFRLVVNTGPDGGQSVGHLHIHLLGGRALDWPPG